MIFQGGNRSKSSQLGLKRTPPDQLHPNHVRIMRAVAPGIELLLNRRLDALERSYRRKLHFEPVPANGIHREKAAVRASLRHFDQKATPLTQLADVAALRVAGIGGDCASGQRVFGSGVHMSESPVVQVAAGQAFGAAGRVIFVLRVPSQVRVKDADRELGSLPVKETGEVFGHSLVRIGDPLDPAKNLSVARDLRFFPACSEHLHRGGQAHEA